MEKKYLIFISSTWRDLKEERRIVALKVLEENYVPRGMELFPATDDDQLTTIKQAIDECDYYVVIISGVYGSIEPKSKKSYTQIEYEYAKSKGIPILAFVMEDIGQLASSKVEYSEEGRKKLGKFKKELQNSKLYKSWTNADNLASSVVTALNKATKTHPREGWIKCDKNMLKEVCTDNFFYTLYQKPGSGFPDLVKDAKKVFIMARTAVNLLSQYEREFEDMAKRKCEVRVLFISPTSDASNYVYGSDPDIFKDNMNKMTRYIKRIQQKSKESFRAKSIDHAPTMSLIIVEKEKPEEDFIIVQLYFLQSRIAMDRPLFKIAKNEKWYYAFYEEFVKLWEIGKSEFE